MIGEKEKEIIFSVIGLIAILAIGFFFWAYFNSQKSITGDDFTNPDLGNNDIYVEEASFDDVRSDFPENFPIERGVESADSYRYTPAGDALKQSTLSYNSRLSLLENTEIFEGFLIANNFALKNQVNKTNMVFLYGQKGSEIFSITIKDQNGVVLVNVSYTK